MKVWVATYEHRHGQDVHVFASAFLAEAWRQEIAAEWYDHEINPDNRPEDPEEAADKYFDLVNDEYFNTEECELEGTSLITRMLAALDKAHAKMEATEAGGDLFNEIGCLIAEAKGEYAVESAP